MTQPICDVVLPDGTRCGYVAVGLTQRDRVTDLHRHQHAYHVVSETVTATLPKAQFLSSGKSVGVPDDARAELHRQQTIDLINLALVTVAPVKGKPS